MSGVGQNVRSHKLSKFIQIWRFGQYVRIQNEFQYLDKKFAFRTKYHDLDKNVSLSRLGCQIVNQELYRSKLCEIDIPLVYDKKVDPKYFAAKRAV